MNKFYVWRKSLDCIKQYYLMLNDGVAVYICPQCDLAEEDFDTFRRQHGSHAGAFERPKASYKNMVRDMFAGRQREMQQDGRCYIWSEGEDKARDCYRVDISFVCPSCSIAESDWEKFKHSHSNHASNFTRSKATYVNLVKEAAKFHIWSREDSAIRHYNAVNSGRQFLCPTCKRVEDDFGAFKRHHSAHAGAFTEFSGSKRR